MDRGRVEAAESGPPGPTGAALLEAVAVMDRLRRECPWDREQTHVTLLPYLVEESYELVDAVEAGDSDHVREELGDVLLQVLFHSRVAEEDAEQPFGIDDVAATLVAKLRRRHPHVFGDGAAATAADVQTQWERIKRDEKQRSSVLDGIPTGLPALSLAAAVVDKAAGAAIPLSVPSPDETTGATEETLGDVLFALVAAARAAGLDPERALRLRVRQEMATVRQAEPRAMPEQADPRR